MSFNLLVHHLYFEDAIVDAGPYWFWYSHDSCRIVIVKPFQLLHQEFQDAGFCPADSQLPYRRVPGKLVVTKEMQLFGWAIASPWFQKDQ